MQYCTLGNTDCAISSITLGTMTWGRQNNEQDAWQQLDYAIEQGINCIDTAEMYPVPAQKKTYGFTETYIGNWLAARKNRDKLVLATKVVGPSGMSYIRPRPDLDRQSIEHAIEGSLRRLRTDYIDLYQLHWPSRRTNFFSTLNYTENDQLGISMLETLESMTDLVKDGKVRYIGVSNETPWGTMHMLLLAQRYDLPNIVSIQNPYSLLNRTPEIGLAEVCWREKVSFLSYSPLAFGALSGKYLGGEQPAGARLTLFKEFSRYSSAKAAAATQEYVDLARRCGLDPAQMALAYINQKPFVSSNIIGATTMEQLRNNIASVDIQLDSAVIQAIENIGEQHPNPCP